MPAKLLVKLMFCMLLISMPRLYADTLNIAVASNFAKPMQQLALSFESVSGHKLNIIKGSSGKHYAQISLGAPFDVFFSADSQRTLLLAQQGKAVAASRRVYAVGQLVLWSQADISPHSDEAEIKSLLQNESIRKIALANPKLAPYGKAAQQVLATLGLTDSLSDKLVMGENIAQTFQFAYSRNAQVGFVALSQVLALDQQGLQLGSYWQIPSTYYGAIEQEMIVITQSPATDELMTFLASAQAKQIISQAGYLLPQSDQHGS